MLLLLLLLLLNIFDDVPVCRRVTVESWAWAVTWRISEMQGSKDEYAVTYMSNTCNAKVNHVCDHQTSTTTNFVDIKWTITVINNLQPPPNLFTTPHIPSPAHCHGPRPLWQINTNFWQHAVWAGDFWSGQKRQLLPTILAFGTPIEVISSEFLRDLLYHKTRVLGYDASLFLRSYYSPGLWCSAVFEIISLTIFIQYRLVTDRWTDRHPLAANTALTQHRAVTDGLKLVMTTILRALYYFRQKLHLKAGGFCCSKVLLPICPCWRQLVYLD